jgi:hypothetical protein
MSSAGPYGAVFDAGWTGSVSRNGRNLYVTNTLSGRWGPVPWAWAEADLPFTLLRAEQRSATEIHRYGASGPGDASIRIGVDLAGVAEALFSSKAPDPAKGPGREWGAPLSLNLTVPSGKSTSHYVDAAGRRIYFPPEAQLGGGLWKPGLSLAFYHRVGPLVPIGSVSYTHGRMLNPSGYLMTDTVSLSAGALAFVSPEHDFRCTAMLLGVWNAYDIRYRDRTTGRMTTIPDSHGWLLFGTLDLSIRVYKGLSAQAGALVPLWKTVGESPNDLDFQVRAGLRVAF